MAKKYEFDAVIRGDETKDIGWIEFPWDVEQEFGTRGQVKVQVTFDGYLYRGSLARMGQPCHFIGLTRAARAAIGKGPGDSVHVILEQDLSPRVVTVPEDLARRLADEPAAAAFFKSLSYTHQKEYVNWITEARKPETRQARLDKALEMLRSGIKSR
ncbi:MAG TPA: YdeI/OmpD-associated family protein [bacterium]|mgnify:CR=1 FL=1|nr:YdeI/OmpD-associated family protein [bacterium]HQG46885.1 YdeI/OmpD-associated family protein [bacterium]HQI50265.1 YdeI/OmpD-associated family protein [bacterium]HQJ65026.1 YdeI/OmpD-associated family protein [bacterium]